MSREKQWAHLYNRAIWRGPNGVRGLKLRRDPLCEILGCTNPATCVDHIKKHRGDWTLFIGGNNMENLRSLCQPHHDAKEQRYEDGKESFNPTSATGTQGRQFLSSNLTSEQLDRAIGSKQELKALLEGIPE